MNEPKDDLGDTISNKKEGSIDRKSIKLEDDISKTEKPFPNYPKTSNENGQHNSTSCCQQIKNKKKKEYMVYNYTSNCHSFYNSSSCGISTCFEKGQKKKGYSN